MSGKDQYEIDILLLYSDSCDNVLYYHTVSMISDLMNLIGKKTLSINIDHNKIDDAVRKSRHVIFYRTSSIMREVIKKIRPDISIGYLIDDNIFYEEFYLKKLSEKIRSCIRSADYCLANSIELTFALSKINPKSYCIGNIPVWKERLESNGIIEPLRNKHDVFTIGIISGMAYEDKIISMINTISDAARNTGKNIRVVYFSQSAIKIPHLENVIFDHKKRVGNIKEWYNILHSIPMDVVYAEFENNQITKCKTNLKFRESAYMKVPLIALDPSGKIYPGIINGKNGYSVRTRDEAIEAIRAVLLKDRKEISEMGERAYKTLMKTSPKDSANNLISILDKNANYSPTIQVFKPKIRPESVMSVSETLLSGWIGCGPKTKQFEKNFESYLQTSQACIATMSATDALEIAVKLLDIKDGDSVITTPITFISTNHAIIYSGATPIFADVDMENGNISPESIEEKITGNTKAIMIVHLSGNSCDMGKIEKIAEKHNIKIIEDCAHAAGGYYTSGKYSGKKIGSSDNICCFSFQSVKNLPCGDGGMLVVPKEMESRAIKLRWMGIDKDTYSRTSTTGEYLWKYDVTELGIKANQNDIMSSIGIVQLTYLDEDNDRRREIASFYKKHLSQHPKIKMPNIDISKSACHFYPIYVEGRDGLLNYLRQNDIFCGVHYRRNDKYDNYQEQYLPSAEYIEQHTLTLPIHLFLTDGDLMKIVGLIKEWK